VQDFYCQSRGIAGSTPVRLVFSEYVLNLSRESLKALMKLPESRRYLVTPSVYTLSCLSLLSENSKEKDLKQLEARSGVQVKLLPGHLLHCCGSQEGLLRQPRRSVGVLGPITSEYHADIPSGYDRDDGSEEEVQVPARDWSVDTNTCSVHMLQSTNTCCSLQTHVAVYKHIL